MDADTIIRRAADLMFEAQQAGRPMDVVEAVSRVQRGERPVSASAPTGGPSAVLRASAAHGALADTLAHQIARHAIAFADGKHKGDEDQAAGSFVDLMNAYRKEVGVTASTRGSVAQVTSLYGTFAKALSGLALGGNALAAKAEKAEGARFAASPDPRLRPVFIAGGAPVSFRK